MRSEARIVSCRRNGETVPWRRVAVPPTPPDTRTIGTSRPVTGPRRRADATRSSGTPPFRLFRIRSLAEAVGEEFDDLIGEVKGRVPFYTIDSILYGTNSIISIVQRGPAFRVRWADSLSVVTKGMSLNRRGNGLQIPEGGFQTRPYKLQATAPLPLQLRGFNRQDRGGRASKQHDRFFGSTRKRGIAVSRGTLWIFFDLTAGACVTYPPRLSNVLGAHAEHRRVTVERVGKSG